MKKDLIRMAPIDHCRSPLEPPTFILGKRYFAVSRPGLENHLYFSRADGYRLVYQLLGGSRSPAGGFASAGFDLAGAGKEPRLHRLLLSVTGPTGGHVRPCQVVFTLIGADGSHRMVQGIASTVGHSLIFEWDDPRPLRVETEVVADGCFITDHFILEMNPALN